MNEQQFLKTSWLGETTNTTADAVQISSPFEEETAQRMIEHMNDDHIDAMVDYCRFAGIANDGDKNNNPPCMTAIGSDGFILLFGNKKIKFDFEQTCASSMDVRKALVELAKKARTES